MSAAQIWYVTSFYRFLSLEDHRLAELRVTIQNWMTARSLRGLILLAPEGINGTVAGAQDDVDNFKAFVQGLIQVQDVRFKDSTSPVRPFRRLSVDIREEIVGLKRPELQPESTENRHLSPAEWHEWLLSDRPKQVIDTRNRYETMAGKFKGAVDPSLKNFSDWTEYLDRGQLSKEIPVLMYCTGGIRCEKAILEMRERGFLEVHQLRDGILGYLAEFPDGEFEGECFVFDDRVTVGQNLQPTGNFGICPGCGLTASKVVQCEWCRKEFFQCDDCDGVRPAVCCKTCLNRLTHPGPNRKRATPNSI